MYTQVLIDLNNLPAKIRIFTGLDEEVTCRQHFLERFRHDSDNYKWGFTVVTRLEQAEASEQCFNCTHNP